MVTLRFEHEGASLYRAFDKVNVFVRTLAKTYRTQIAAFAVVNTFKNPHAHLLLLSGRRCLSGLTTYEVDRMWGHGSAHARRCEDEGAGIYAAINITPNKPDCFDVFWINNRLLAKTRQARRAA